ncbi:MAG TPA: hypothetical protein VEK07_17180 [Polyangiaceae bacterium]|nr:hypothetical protein [Polyangiaceae bacterium]
MRTLALGAVALASLASAASPARADDSAASGPAPIEGGLQAAVAQQGAAIEALRALLDSARKRFESGQSLVHLSGFLQVDWVVYDQASQDQVNGSTGAPLNEDRFTLRRGHLRADVEKGLLQGALEIDANTTSGPQVRPIEADVGFRWPLRAETSSIGVTVGLTRIPFGYEVQELDWVRPFLERATVLQALFPGEFDLGLRFNVRYRFVDWAFAMMNGSPIGSKVFPDLDPAAAKEIIGRVSIDVPIASGIRFQAGISGDSGTGFHAGTPATKPQLEWQDQNGSGVVEPNEIIAVGGSPATRSQLFHRFAVGGDARLFVRLGPLGDFSLRTEVVDAVNLDRGLEVADPISAGRDLREVGWSAGATQELTRWAMIGARYDLYNPDADASQQRGVNLVPVDRTYATLALVAMLRYAQARLLLEYDVNRNPLGIGANGAPTTLADNALTLRTQLVF